jgi:hypothetical protein
VIAEMQTTDPRLLLILGFLVAIIFVVASIIDLNDWFMYRDEEDEQ